MQFTSTPEYLRNDPTGSRLTRKVHDVSKLDIRLQFDALHRDKLDQAVGYDVIVPADNVASLHDAMRRAVAELGAESSPPELAIDPHRTPNGMLVRFRAGGIERTLHGFSQPGYMLERRRPIANYLGSDAYHVLSLSAPGRSPVREILVLSIALGRIARMGAVRYPSHTWIVDARPTVV